MCSCLQVDCTDLAQRRTLVSHGQPGAQVTVFSLERTLFKKRVVNWPGQDSYTLLLTSRSYYCNFFF